MLKPATLLLACLFLSNALHASAEARLQRPKSFGGRKLAEFPSKKEDPKWEAKKTEEQKYVTQDSQKSGYYKYNKDTSGEKAPLCKLQDGQLPAKLRQRLEDEASDFAAQVTKDTLAKIQAAIKGCCYNIFEFAPKCKGYFHKEHPDKSGRYWSFENGVSCAFKDDYGNPITGKEAAQKGEKYKWK